MAKSLNILSREEEVLNHWYTALGAEIGIEIKVLDGRELQEVLAYYYMTRKNQNDPKLSVLSIVRSPHSRFDTFWIIKRIDDDKE